MAIQTRDALESPGAVRLAIANEIVRLLAQLYGRGPTKARTLINDDLVVCRLSEPYTRSELTMLAAGQLDAVRRLRKAFHEHTREAFEAVVERHCRRRVEGFVAEVYAQPHVAVLVFFLKPRRPSSENRLALAR